MAVLSYKIFGHMTHVRLHVKYMHSEWIAGPGACISDFFSKQMPRRARIHFVSLRSSLVNLPISIYGPLLERGVVGGRLQ